MLQRKQFQSSKAFQGKKEQLIVQKTLREQELDRFATEFIQKLSENLSTTAEHLQHLPIQIFETAIQHALDADDSFHKMLEVDLKQYMKNEIQLYATLLKEKIKEVEESRKNKKSKEMKIIEQVRNEFSTNPFHICRPDSLETKMRVKKNPTMEELEYILQCDANYFYFKIYSKLLLQQKPKQSIEHLYKFATLNFSTSFVLAKFLLKNWTVLSKSYSFEKMSSILLQFFLVIKLKYPFDNSKNTLDSSRLSNLHKKEEKNEAKTSNEIFYFMIASLIGHYLQSLFSFYEEDEVDVKLRKRKEDCWILLSTLFDEIKGFEVSLALHSLIYLPLFENQWFEKAMKHKDTWFYQVMQYLMQKVLAQCMVQLEFEKVGDYLKYIYIQQLNKKYFQTNTVFKSADLMQLPLQLARDKSIGEKAEEIAQQLQQNEALLLQTLRKHVFQITSS